MATTPNYASTPRAATGVLSAANTNRDGTGTIVTILTAGSSGSRVDVVTVAATSTTTAGMVRLYTHDGTNARLLREVQVSAITPSGTQPSFNTSLTFDGGILLPSGWSLRASTHNAESFHVTALGGDF